MKFQSLITKCIKYHVCLLAQFRGHTKLQIKRINLSIQNHEVMTKFDLLSLVKRRMTEKFE